MKKNIFSLLFLGLLLSVNTQAQLPTASHADYSTKTGTVTDKRDGKSYAYKKYGDKEWFIQNLAYEGIEKDTKGIDVQGKFLPSDPTGELYGMYYPSATNNSTSVFTKFCPEGWSAPTKTDYKTLFNALIETYSLTDVQEGEKDAYANLAKYLRAGGVVGVDTAGLWATGTTIDTKAAQIGFNALPTGVIDGTTGNAEGTDAPGVRASFLTGTWWHYWFNNLTEAVSHINRKSIHHGSIRCQRNAITFPEGEVTTPYYTTIELRQIVGAELERIRLCQSQKKFEQQPTGFYLEKGKKLIVNVEELAASTDGVLPSIVIGTMGQINNAPKEISLTPGLNTIEASQHGGGLIYLKYVTLTESAPQGRVNVTFDSAGEHIRTPQYVYGTTTDAEFSIMLGKYPKAVETIFYSDYAVIVALRDHAITYSMKEKKDKWMESLHTLLDVEDKISGLDNNDIKSIHHRHKTKEVRHLLVHNPSVNPHASPNGYTAYPASAIERYLTREGLYDRPWMVGHEVGHQHQQTAYLIEQAMESTVNIYSYVINRHVVEEKGNVYVRTPLERWQAAQNTYLSLPIDQRIYNLTNDQIKEIVGFNGDELRFMIWEQIFIMFGDDFYKNLHRVTREEKKIGGLEQERRAYLIWKISQVSGYDLRSFFNEWGIRLTDEYDINLLNKKIEDGLADGTIYPMPETGADLVRITAQEKPSWAPLALKGITTSEPDLSNVHPTDELTSKNKYTDYSTSKNTFVDLRDNKVYTYKKYGSFDWFTQNLDFADERVNIPLDPNMPAYKASLYLPADPEGKVYGRMYVTYAGNAIYSTWCPEGWKVASSGDWNTLQTTIKEEYGLDNKSVASAMMSGGDRDRQADGLWSKGALGEYATDAQRTNVGFNILPAGVYSTTMLDYESGDARGLLGSFFEPYASWYHQAFYASSSTSAHPNRNARHYASIRCLRATTDLSGIASNTEKTALKVYSNTQTIYVDASEMSSDFTTNSTINVYNTVGAKVKTLKVTDAVTSIAVSVSGVYIVEVVSATSKQNFKVVVK